MQTLISYGLKVVLLISLSGFFFFLLKLLCAFLTRRSLLRQFLADFNCVCNPISASFKQNVLISRHCNERKVHNFYHQFKTTILQQQCIFIWFSILCVFLCFYGFSFCIRFCLFLWIFMFVFTATITTIELGREGRSAQTRVRF